MTLDDGPGSTPEVQQTPAKAPAPGSGIPKSSRKSGLRPPSYVGKSKIIIDKIKKKNELLTQ